jgi:hypothetical protein
MAVAAVIIAIAGGGCGRTDLNPAAARDAAAAGADAATADAGPEVPADPCAGRCLAGQTCAPRLFAAAADVVPDVLPYALVVDDLNGDGKLDLAYVQGADALLRRGGDHVRHGAVPLPLMIADGIPFEGFPS